MAGKPDEAAAGTVRCRAVAHGLVQGVFFRASARVQANRLGLSGWVRNRRDGSVEAVFEGPRGACEQFLAWFGRGPERASVDRVAVSWETPTGEFEYFDVVYE